MELIVLALALVALAASPALTIAVLARRDKQLLDAASSSLLTFLRNHAGTGDTPALAEQRIELKKEELKAAKEQRALEAANLRLRAAALEQAAGE